MSRIFQKGELYLTSGRFPIVFYMVIKNGNNCGVLPHPADWTEIKMRYGSGDYKLVLGTRKSLSGKTLWRCYELKEIV